MRVVTWNVQTARPTAGGARDVERLATHVRGLDADVVALQELDRGMRRSGGVDQAQVVADALGGRLLWAPTVHRGGGAYGHAVVAVRAEVAAWRVVPLGGTRESRALLVAELDHDGVRWAVGATHLSRRTRTATAQLARCLEALAAHPRPRVLVGDLNLPPRRVLPHSTAHGHHLVTGPPTHPAPRPRTRLDHVLVQGARVAAARVPAPDVSDHRPVVVDLVADRP